MNKIWCDIPFDKDLIGKPDIRVITQDGVVIVADQIHSYNVDTNSLFCISGIVNGKLNTWDNYGNVYHNGFKHPNDLKMQRCKREGWINVYIHNDVAHTGESIHETEEKALSKRRTGWSGGDTITIKIEY